jgi:RNA polymerase sigma-70 factor (ECF subfamily)
VTTTRGHQPNQRDVDALRDGDAGAWTRVVTWLQPQLDGFFRAGGASDHEALSQETLLRMSRHIARFERGGADELRAWAFAIARTTRIDDARRTAARPRTIAESARAGSDDADRSIAGSLADDAVPHDEHLAAIDRVEQLLDSLTDQQAELLRLRIHGDLTLEAAAATLGLALGAAKQLQRRALRRLATLVDDSERPSTPGITDDGAPPEDATTVLPASGTPP